MVTSSQDNSIYIANLGNLQNKYWEIICREQVFRTVIIIILSKSVEVIFFKATSRTHYSLQNIRRNPLETYKNQVFISKCEQITNILFK